MARRKKRLPTEPQAAHITDLTHEGKGVAHIDGKTVFVSEALPGEDIEFIYTAKHRNYDEGRLHRVVAGSSQRIEARCMHFGVCGGCSLQHLAPADQIAMKQKVLLDNLQRIGHVSPAELLPPLLGPEWGYRRKARLGVKYVDKKHKLLIGFREKASRYLADLSVCEVLHPSVGQHLPDIAAMIMTLSIFKAIPQIEVAVGEQSTALVVRHLQELTEQDRQQLTAFATEHGFDVYLQAAGPDSITALSPDTADLYYSLPEYDLRFDFLPSDFTQVNAQINCRMIPAVIRELECQPGQTILELFCGLGNFTLPIARQVAKVIAVEGESALIDRARENAGRNGVSNVDYHVANLMEETTELAKLNWWKQDYDRVFMDPPRSGAEQVIPLIAGLGVKRIVYVSCNPATLARDAGLLVNEHGYRLQRAGVMDMFPHTAHVESLAVFVKD